MPLPVLPLCPPPHAERLSPSVSCPQRNLLVFDCVNIFALGLPSLALTPRAPPIRFSRPSSRLLARRVHPHPRALRFPPPRAHVTFSQQGYLAGYTSMLERHVAWRAHTGRVHAILPSQSYLVTVGDDALRIQVRVSPHKLPFYSPSRVQISPSPLCSSPHPRQTPGGFCHGIMKDDHLKGVRCATLGSTRNHVRPNPSVGSASPEMTCHRRA